MRVFVNISEGNLGKTNGYYFIRNLFEPLPDKIKWPFKSHYMVIADYEIQLNAISVCPGKSNISIECC
ncbi:hypothetical protein D3C87_2206360 [compost metagenome]